MFTFLKLIRVDTALLDEGEDTDIRLQEGHMECYESKMHSQKLFPTFPLTRLFLRFRKGLSSQLVAFELYLSVLEK